MKRVSFIVLASAAFLARPERSRSALATVRVRSVVRLGRADRSILVGTAGGCASRRAPGPWAGYVPGDFV